MRLNRRYVAILAFAAAACDEGTVKETVNGVSFCIPEQNRPAPSFYTIVVTRGMSRDEGFNFGVFPPPVLSAQLLKVPLQKGESVIFGTVSRPQTHMGLLAPSSDAHYGKVLFDSKSISTSVPGSSYRISANTTLDPYLKLIWDPPTPNSERFTADAKLVAACSGTSCRRAFEQGGYEISYAVNLGEAGFPLFAEFDKFVSQTVRAWECSNVSSP